MAFATQLPLRFSVQFPYWVIDRVIANACIYTATNIANDLRDYMLLRFSEPKSGRWYYVPSRGRYRASAPGEYPAIKYGILYRSLVTRRRYAHPLGAGVTFGARPFSGSSYGRRNDPDYARRLEGLERSREASRPYFVRAMLETMGTRPNNARAWFVGYLYDRATAYRRRRGPASGVFTGDDAMDLLPYLGARNFAEISAGIRQGRWRQVI